MTAQGKWLRKLTPATPIDEAARRALRKRVRPVPRLLKRAARPGCEPGPDAIHELRVSTRRATAALRAFTTYLPAKKTEAVLKALRQIRRAAAPIREIDVHTHALTAQAESLDRDDPLRGALEVAASRLSARRAGALDDLVNVRRRIGAKWLAKACRELEDRITIHPGASEALCGAARGAFAATGERARAAVARDLTRLADLHELRLAGKGLRYTLEVFAACLDERDRSRIYSNIAQMQERLGQINDAAQHAEALAGLLGELPEDQAAALRALADAANDHAHRAVAAFAREGWPAKVVALLGEIDAALAGADAGPRPPGVPDATAPQHTSENGHASLQGAAPRAAPIGEVVLPSRAGVGRADSARSEPFRVAAVDVGTNSIRLIIAEAGGDAPGEGHGTGGWGWGGGYRVLDDEREVARLGRGLDATGKLDPAAMKAAAIAIARMKGIAEGYGVSHLLVIGTAAVRDASNGAEFVELVRETAGLTMEVIDGEQEARLAFRSAAAAFDLSGVHAAVCDIGGGSTEVVISSNGVLDHLLSIPIGAVRLTERFGGPAAAAGENFDDMVEHVRDLFRRRLDKIPLTPQVFIGTGGTFTALANIVVLADLGQPGDGLFSGHVQGHEIKSWQVKHVLDNLRKMPLRDRQHVPGLNPDRADIIVAGLVLVDALMKRLGVNKLLVHEGGIRDGLLRTMVARLTGDEDTGKLDPLRAVRRFARACGYEHRHCQHVTRLALSIFDQLAAPGRKDAIDPDAAELLTARSRMLLEAGSILHDVGYLINYDQHHKHGYHLIVHADLPGFSAAEIGVIANLARYHRRSEPKRGHRNFDRLAKAERDLVELLAGILRIADGLDRTHTQRVERIELMPGPGGREMEFVVTAPVEPEVDIWGATRKADLFRRVFRVDPSFRWVVTPPAATEPAPHAPLQSAR